MHEIGLRINGAQLDNNPASFIQQLENAKEAGYEAIELCPEDFDAIRYGELEERVVESLKQILDGYLFKISVHAPLQLNIFNREDSELHVSVLQSCAEFTRRIGGDVLVYHPGRYVDNVEFARYGKPNITSSARKKLKKYEVNVLQDIADSYSDIVFAMENQRPYIDYSPYCYAEYLDKLCKQVSEIDRGNVGMTIDTGHLLLSAGYYKYDFLHAVKKLKCLPVHIHVNDNHGIPTFFTEKDKKSQHPFGRGDEHIVPGTGVFPFREFFSLLPGYSGRYIIELTNRSLYPARIRESIANVRMYLEP